MLGKFIRRMIIIIFLLAIIFVLFKVVKIQDIILKGIYPTTYSEYVVKYSEKNDLDKYMVYSIIKAESNFNPNVKSQSDAIGLMQLLEETANERANIIEDNNVK